MVGEGICLVRRYKRAWFSFLTPTLPGCRYTPRLQHCNHHSSRILTLLTNSHASSLGGDCCIVDAIAFVIVGLIITVVVGINNNVDKRNVALIALILPFKGNLEGLGY